MFRASMRPTNREPNSGAPRRVRLVLACVAATSTLGAGIALAANAAQGGERKSWVDPWKGLTATEREATVTAVHGAERSWFQAFIDSGADARSLPRFTIEGYAGPVADINTLRSSADVIAVVRVERQSFSLDEGAPVPNSTVDAQVVSVLAGDIAEGAYLKVVQVGGPMRSSTDGVGSLAQLQGLPLLFAGDVVILAAVRDEDGTFHALPGLGIHFTDGGVVAGTETSSPSPLTGLSIGEATRLLSLGNATK